MSLGLLGPCEVQAWTDRQGRSRTETLAYDLLLLVGRCLLRGGSCRSVRVLREHGSGRGFLVPKGTELSAKDIHRSRCEWSRYFLNVAATLAVGRGGSCADSRRRGFPMNQGPTAPGMPWSSCPSSQNTAGAAFSSSTLTGFAMSSSKLKSPFHFVSSKMQPPTFRRRVAPASGGVLFSRGPCRRQQVTG